MESAERTAAEQQLLDRYKALLLQWTAKINLVGPEARERIDDHIEEAVFAARCLAPRGEVLDVGSGGGLPAIPMAIVSPDARFHLVESDRRKWAFLKFAVRECGLNSLVHGDRLTAVLARLTQETRFALVTSRGVGKPVEWVPEVAGRLEPQGRIALFQRKADVPPIARFELERSVRLPRGDENYLAILRMVRVEA